MKKLLYIDLVSPAGHDNFDMNLLRLISKSYDVDVMVRESMIRRIPECCFKNIRACPPEIFPETWHSKHGIFTIPALAWRKKQYSFIKKVLKETAKDYDYVFFSSIEVISFTLATRHIGYNRFSFVDHGIYRLKNNLTRFFYRHVLRHDITIITLEEYVKEYMRKNGVTNPTYVIHHPVPVEKKRAWISLIGKEVYTVFAPSTSNDEGFISELKMKKDKIPSNIRIIVKSHTGDVGDERLKVFKRRIPEEEYCKMFDDADFILVPYAASYNYRTSAILFEALSKGKRVLLWGNNTLKDYFKEYKKCVCVFHDVDDLLKQLASPKSLEYDKNEIERFMDNYSDEYITNQIKQAFA